MNNGNFVVENYVKTEFNLNINKARLIGIIVLTFSALIFGLPFFLLWRENIHFFQENIVWYRRLINIGIFVLIALFGIVFHEIIHGIFAAIFNKNGFKSIKFGVLPSKGVAYCVNSEILRKNNYIIGLIMPGIILGIIPSFVSIFTGNFALLIFGILFTFAASGDLLLLIELQKDKHDSWIEDNVTKSGVKIYIYRQNKLDT